MISVFYKAAGLALAAAATDVAGAAERLLNPDDLRAGDRYSRVFRAELPFENGSDASVLRDVFARFNGEGSLPEGVRLPRSISAGDIIVGMDAGAFLVTETGFRALAFAPRGEEFEVTGEHLARNLHSSRKAFHALTADQAED
jgi:hypothetical protein